MDKAYTKITFRNNQSPALDATNLNSISTAIDTIDNRVIQSNSDLVNQIESYSEYEYRNYSNSFSGTKSFYPRFNIVGGNVYIVKLSFSNYENVTNVSLRTSTKESSSGVVDVINSSIKSGFDNYIITFKASANASLFIVDVTTSGSASVSFAIGLSDSIGKMVSDIQTEVNSIDNFTNIVKVKTNDLPFSVRDCVIKSVNESDGTLSNTTTRITTPIFFVPACTWFDFGTNSSRVFFYNEDESYIRGTYKWNYRRLYISEDCYCRISLCTKNADTITDSIKASLYESIVPIYYGTKEIMKEETLLALKSNNSILDKIMFEKGAINESTGAISSSSNSIVSDFFIAPKGLTIYSNFTNSSLRITKYNSDKTRSGNIVWNKTEYTFAEDSLVRVEIRDGNTISYDSWDSMINGIETKYVSHKEQTVNEVKSLGKIVFSIDASDRWVNQSDFTFIGNDLYVINASDDNHQTYNTVEVYEIDFDNKTATYKKSIQHNLGHSNTIDYNPHNDSIIVGNAGSSVALGEKVFILDNISNREVWNYSDCTVIDLSSDLHTYKTQAVWGESNIGRNNIIYVIDNDNRGIYKVLLTQTNNEFDGGYVLLESWINDTYYEVNQGSVYYNGYVYTSIGHSQIWLLKHRLMDNGTIECVEYKDVIYDNTGAVMNNPSSEGCTIKDNYILIGTSQGEILVYNLVN